MPENQPIPPGYCILYNSITDTIAELQIIKGLWQAHPFLQRDLEQVILLLIRAQQDAETIYVEAGVDNAKATQVK